MAFPTSGLTNNQVHKEGNRAFVYDSTLGVWDQVRETDRTENKIQSGTIGSGVTFPAGRHISRFTDSGTLTVAAGVPVDLDSVTADAFLFTYSAGSFTCVEAGLYLFCGQFATGTVVDASKWVGWYKGTVASGSFAQSHFTVRPAYTRTTDSVYLPKLVVNTIRCATSDVMSLRSTATYAFALDQTSITIVYLAP